MKANHPKLVCAWVCLQADGEGVVDFTVGRDASVADGSEG
jgi:hypothetical protein